MGSCLAKKVGGFPSRLAAFPSAGGGNARLHFAAPRLASLSKWPWFRRGIAGKPDTRSSLCSAGGLVSSSPRKGLGEAGWGLLVQQISLLNEKHTSERHSARKSLQRGPRSEIPSNEISFNNCLLPCKERRVTVRQGAVRENKEEPPSCKEIQTRN